MVRRRPDPYELRRKVALLERGITQYDLAARWGRTQAFVSHLINGISRSNDLEADLAKLLRIPREQLFLPHPGPRGSGRKPPK